MSAGRPSFTDFIKPHHVCLARHITGNNKRKMADFLGISREALNHLLRVYELNDSAPVDKHSRAISRLLQDQATQLFQKAI